MNNPQESDAEHILLSSDCLLEKTQKFIDTHVSGITFCESDDKECLLLMQELKTCLDVLESLHQTYQARLKNNTAQVEGMTGYAQTMSLTSNTQRGDLSHVE